MRKPLLVATRKGLFRARSTDAGWSIADAWFVGDNIPMVLQDPRDGAIYAVIEHGHFGTKLHKSTDDGATWAEIGVPTYPEQGPDDVEINQWGGKPLEWKLNKIWALEPGAVSQPGLLWCGTIPGGLFKSTDGGATWAIVDSLWRHPKRKGWFGGGADFPGIHSIVVDPRDPNHVIVGVSCGGAWRTTDGGGTWENCATGMFAEFMPPEQQYDPNIQDPHRIVGCPSNPDTLWTQHHNGIFRTTDGAKSWHAIKDVKPSGFGFAVVVHPDDADRAWFVPGIKDEKRIPVDGKLVVTRTRDGGETFDVLSNGLPGEHAYDLVYRHGMDITPSGDVLAFGSTTGSVWISEDQGDSWRAVSKHLPPVYCLRFGA